MPKLLTNRNKTFLRAIMNGSLIFYGLSCLTSVLNYAYYPVIARVVSTDTYGETQFLTSLYMQLTVGLVVLNILSIIISAKYTVDHERQKILRSLNTVAMTTVLIIIAVGTGALIIGKDSFGFTSVVPVLLLGLVLLINVPFIITIGKLQGQSKFVRSGVVTALGSLLKLLFAFAFVAVGWGTAGAIGGIAAGMALALAAATVFDKSSKQPERNVNPNLAVAARLYLDHFKRFRNERALLFAALVSMSLLTLLSTADVVISKTLLSPFQAGQYAGVATVSKVILYATAPLMWLALPLALANLPQARAKVHRYVGLTAIIALLLLGAFIATKSIVVTKLLGIDAGSYLSLLPMACVAMVLFSIAFILIAVDLCRYRLRVAILASLGALAGFVVGFFALRNGGSVKAAIVGQIAAAAIAMVVSLIGNRMYGKRS